ncbi:50S ribosomal protein L13 [Natronogracilivirga saccharolytica]|uniref:Large ribosomal subunit protein uL13 n=1 Tax=Natronogracilivirga saccharolytica TaxID=2812953 RepID=A0A8J7RQE8_9BACT|nr:50S ribosomal protein L13 [Natronogracilivirga saccharolytica]
MNTESFKTYSAKPGEVQKKWVVVDAEGQPLGRLASKVATILRGKHKPEFTPHIDTGDNVIVVNAEKVSLSGKKMTDKVYFRHSGYPGGTKFTNPEEVLKKDPAFLVKNAVQGMIPKNRLGRKLLTNLRVFAGPDHTLKAQKPEKIEL